MTDEQKKKKDEQEVQVPPVPAPTLVEMEQAQADELSALQKANQQRYNDVSDIVADAEARLGSLKVKDEAEQKRSNAFRYIAGLGDTLSGLANVIGTSFGAQNQQQTYNGGYVAEKAEQKRKERKLEMDKISARIDEMRAREKDLKAAGSLAEAELKAKQTRELFAEKIREEEAARKNRELDIDEINAQANLTRAKATETNAETKANKPSTSKTKPKVVVAMGSDGTMTEYDVSKYKNFDKDYQRALDAAIADGTSGLSDTEIDDYQKAVKRAKTDSGKALNEFLRTHTYRQSVIDRMNTGSGANNPKYQ